jgi:hypothetical protein
VGTLNLFYRNGVGALAWRSLTDINAWDDLEHTFAVQDAGIVATIPIPFTQVLQVLYVDQATGELIPLKSTKGGAFVAGAPFTSGALGQIAAAFVPDMSVPSDPIAQIFFRNAASELISWWSRNGGSWQGPQTWSDATVGSDISTIRIPGSEILQIFYRATDDSVRTLWREPGGGWGQENLGGTTGSAVAVCNVPGSNAIDIFYTGPQQQVITRQRAGSGTWSAEQTLAGASLSNIAATVLPVPNADVLQLFYRGRSGAVMTMWRDPTTGQFNAESSLGGQVSSGRIATATIPGTSTLGLFYRDNSNALACNFRPVNGPWTGEINRGFTLTSDLTPAASPEAEAPSQPAPGLGSNYNYQMVGIQSPGSKHPPPLIGFNVTIEITEDIISDVGFSFQLNCLCQSDRPGPGAGEPGPPFACDWQQYNWRIGGSGLQWHIENTNLTAPQDSQNLVEALAPKPILLPDAATLRAGWLLSTGLLNDGDGNVNQVGFVAVDPDGNTVLDGIIPLLALQSQNGHVFGPVTQASLAPIVAAQVNFVGPAGVPESHLTSGAGVITYACSQPLTPVGSAPSGIRNVVTAERANSAYAPMTSGPEYSFTQVFSWAP